MDYKSIRIGRFGIGNMSSEMKPKIVLAHPFSGEDPRYQYMVPLGIYKLRTYLEDAVVIDAELEGLDAEQLAERIIDLKPEFAGFSTTYLTVPSTLRTVQIVKNEGISTIVGGIGVRTLTSSDVDFIVCGEGERALERIVFGTEERELVPYARRDLDAYLERAEESLGRRQTNIYTSQGCGNGCKFCSIEPRFMTRDMNDVRAEIGYLLEHGVDSLNVFDDNLFWDTEHARRVTEILSEFPVEWMTEGAVCQLVRNIDLLKAMAESGCYAIEWGVESLDPDVQRRLGKIVPVDDLRRVVNAAYSVGIRSSLLLMYDCGESWDNTMRFIEEMGGKLHEVYVSRLEVIPGTKLEGAEFPTTNESRLKDVEQLCMLQGVRFYRMKFGG